MMQRYAWTFFLYFNVLFLYLSMYSTLIMLEIPKGWETQGVMHVVGAFPRDIFQRQEICPSRVQLNELHKIVPTTLSPSCRRFYNIFFATEWIVLVSQRQPWKITKETYPGAISCVSWHCVLVCTSCLSYTRSCIDKPFVNICIAHDCVAL